MNLTQTAFHNLTASLERFNNTLSTPQRGALFALVKSLTDMATGQLTGRWAFPLFTGCGKTRAIVEWSAAVSKLNLSYSMVVSASRIEALCTLKRDMIEAGVPAESIGLVYSPPDKKDDQYSEPFTTDNESRQFLLCSHQLIRARECNLDLYNRFNGQPRSLVVYDESLLVSDIEFFTVADLCGLMSKWVDKLRFGGEEDKHTDFTNWLTERRARIEFLYGNFEQGGTNEIPEPSFVLPVEAINGYERMVRKPGDVLLADFLSISGLPLRMFKHGKAAIISYRIVIPEALKNMIVLDASYPIRKLEQADTSLLNAESLPACQTHRVKFDNLKRFENVTLYRMAKRGSRSAAVIDHRRMKKLLKDVVEVIKTIPESESILIFTYKAREKQPNPKKWLEGELEEAGLFDSKRINMLTWGSETSLNCYAHCSHVILVGILHRDLSELAAQLVAQHDNLRMKIDGQDLESVSLSERSHCAYQALSRGTCRVMAEEGQAKAMTGYIVEFDEGLETELSRVMPGAKWKEWTPIHSDLIEHGKMVQHWSKLVSHHLCKQPSTIRQLTGRKLRSDLNARKVNRETWRQVMQRVLADTPQWNQQDQSYVRVS